MTASCSAALEFVLNRMGRRAWPDETARAPGLPRFPQRARRRARRDGPGGGGSGRPLRLPRRLHAMNPYERRVVHMTVREAARVDDRLRGRRVPETGPRREDRALDSGGTRARPLDDPRGGGHRAGTRRHRLRPDLRTRRVRHRAALCSAARAARASRRRPPAVRQLPGRRRRRRRSRIPRRVSGRARATPASPTVELWPHGSPPVLDRADAGGDGAGRSRSPDRGVHLPRPAAGPPRSRPSGGGPRSDRRPDRSIRRASRSRSWTGRWRGGSRRSRKA